MEPDPPTAAPEPCSLFAPDGVAEAFRAEWRTETVLGLADGIIADEAFERLPILADALEEAGCDLPELLIHCREPNKHNLACWALTAVTGRKPVETAADLEAELARLTAESGPLRLVIARQQIEEMERRIERLEWRFRWERRFRLLACLGIGWFVGQLISYFVLGIR